MSGERAAPAPLSLRAAFPPVPTSAWEAAIHQDLQGADYEKKLVWRPEEGLSVRPYYRSEDLASMAGALAAPPGESPHVRGEASWEPLDRWAPREEAIRADAWHDAGATAVQELAFAVAAGVDRLAVLTEAGADPQEAAGQIEFAFAVGSRYFLEIAKLRAARMLWSQACAAFGATGGHARMRLHVRTARANKSVLDPYTNLLRATTEALSAVIGGCQRLFVEPFGFDPRLARNVHHILAEEAHLGAVADPAGGAYYVEALTDALARAAWARFQAIEAEGGFGAAWRSGAIEAALSASRAAMEQAVSTRRRTLVGVNNYPDLSERSPAPLPAGWDTAGVPAWRMAGPVEAIRQRTASYAARTGRRPVVLLVRHGDVRTRIARANFCLNFFGCGGFALVETDTLDATGGDLIVLCSADDEYVPLAREFCPRATVPVLVAGNPSADAEALREAGVQGFVHLGSDLVETLSAWQRRLRIE